MINLCITVISIGNILCQLSDHMKDNYIKNRYTSPYGEAIKPFVEVQLVKYPARYGEKEIFDLAAIMENGLSQKLIRLLNRYHQNHN